MVNQQLIDYITAQLQTGVSREVIKSALLESGWGEADVAEAMNRQGEGAKGVAAKPAQSAVIRTSDIFGPQAEPIFQPKGGVKEKPATPVAATSTLAVGASSAKAATAPVGGNGYSTYLKIVVPVVAGVLLVAALIAAGVFYKKTAGLAGKVQSLTAERDGFMEQLGATKKEKSEADAALEALRGGQTSVKADLSIFETPEGTLIGPEVAVAVRGVLHGGDKAPYTVTTKNDVTVSVKNSADAKVSAVLKPLVGSDVEVSGTHLAGSREITVTVVNGAAVQ